MDDDDDGEISWLEVWGLLRDCLLVNVSMRFAHRPIENVEPAPIREAAACVGHVLRTAWQGAGHGRSFNLALLIQQAASWWCSLLAAEVLSVSLALLESSSANPTHTQIPQFTQHEQLRHSHNNHRPPATAPCLLGLLLHSSIPSLLFVGVSSSLYL